MRPALASAAIALVAVSACVDVLGPGDISPTPRRLQVQSVYQYWWAQVEACSGKSANMDRVRWLYVPNGATGFSWQGELVAGLWFEGHTIVLAEALILNDQTVRHEMLHDILGAVGHPSLYFEDLCGPLV